MGDLKKENERMKKWLRKLLPVYCDGLCPFDMNYGDVKFHDPKCAEIRRFLGQKVDEDGRIPDSDIYKIDS